MFAYLAYAFECKYARAFLLCIRLANDSTHFSIYTTCLLLFPLLRVADARIIIFISYSVTVNTVTIQIVIYCSNLVYGKLKRSQSLCDTLASFSFPRLNRAILNTHTHTHRITKREQYECICGLWMEMNQSKTRRKLGRRSIEI